MFSQKFTLITKLRVVCVSLIKHFSGISDTLINDALVTYSDQIKCAIIERKPIICLESAIISHGMPYPNNIINALNVESIIRNNGVIPATIGVINGKICVGLSEKQIDFLGSGNGALKLSRRDLPVALANKLSGGTTVSATSFIANRYGIEIFVTGGIGGVHREWQSSLDISADLKELSRTPITIVCGGVKSILDIEKTLQVLETEGVCVVVYDGEEDIDGKVQFPAFFTPDSGHKIDYNVKTAMDAAKLILTNKRLNTQSAILIAVPILKTYQELSNLVNNAINEAVKEVKRFNISGKQVTPFILKRVNELTDGQSLAANTALIENNARIGCEIAIHYTQLMLQSMNQSKWK